MDKSSHPLLVGEDQVVPPPLVLIVSHNFLLNTGGVFVVCCVCDYLRARDYKRYDGTYSGDGGSGA